MDDGMDDFNYDAPIYIMRDDEVFAHFDGVYLTIEDGSNDGIAVTKPEALKLAHAIIAHFDGLDK